MADKEKAQPEEKPAEETPKVEEAKEPKAPTKEELEQAHGQAQQYEQNWKDAQRVISRKDEEIQGLKDDRELWKAMIGAIAEQTGRTEADVEQDIQTRKPNLTQQFSQIEQRQQQRRYTEKVNSYQTTIEQELGLKEGDDDYDTIQGLVLAGKWDKADKKIEAIKAKKAEPPKTSTEVKAEVKETEEEAEQRKEREAKEYLISKGYLKPEAIEPSAPGGKLTAEMVEKMSPDERFQRREEIGKMSLGLGGEKTK